jgi:hypothetical protein
MENISLADIAALLKNDGDGFGAGGGAWIWVIMLFFLYGAGGFGFGNRGEQYATSADVQRGFDTNEITRKLDGVANGLCDGFYAQNTTMLNGFNTLGMQIAENRFAAQNCCCETNRNIDAVRYEAQKNTCDITTAIHAEGEATRALIRENEIQALRDKVHALEQNAALCGVVRYPNAMTYSAGYSPFCVSPCAATNI